jgi:hypothetical protein
MKKVVWTTAARLVVASVLTTAAASCGSLQREGTSPSYLIIRALEGASGADATPKFGSSVNSDVTPVFNDLGQVELALGLKDAGSANTPTEPTTANFITIDQYHVSFTRTDGHNVQGVDVPYAFDGGLTGTVSNATTLSFTLVRHQAKEEAPLRALGGANQIVISTIAEVTFYGHDQTGRPVSVSGKLSINFANFADSK